MKRITTVFSVVGCLLVSQAALAQSGLQITEVYFGISGPDGTEDFVEISNLGPTTESLGGLFYDDSSLDITAGGDLPNIDLAAGESAVFLVNIEAELDAEDTEGLTPEEIDSLLAAEQAALNAEAIAEFEGLFGPIDNLFALPNGGLSSGGDTAALLDSTGAVIDSFVYGEDDVDELQFVPDGNGGFTVFTATYENLSGFNNTEGNLLLSQEGVNGASGSNTFLTDSEIFGGTEEVEDDPATPEDETVIAIEVPIFIVGSPGSIPASAVVPEPASAALAALTLISLTVGRRRS